MHAFAYTRPATLADAVELLGSHGAEACILAGGTDVLIRLRDGTLAPALLVDVKRIPELEPAIHEQDGRVVISAATVMTDVAQHALIRRHFPALAEAAAQVGSVQIRNRATLGGNLCNASPAADTAPPLLVYGAVIVAVGPGGPRRMPLDDFFIGSGITALAPGELVTAIELPIPADRTGSAHQRRTRRRGHDLASVTLACAIDSAGTARLAYGSVGPRPLVRRDDRGVLADPSASEAAKLRILDEMFGDARPSPRSMRASPEYRLAMLRVLGMRAVRVAIERLGAGA